MNFFCGPSYTSGKKSFEATCQRSEEAEVVRGRRKAETDRVLSFLFVFLKGWPGWFPTARIERPPLYRGGSASKKNGLPAPSHPSEAARCASTGGLPGYPVFFCGSSNFSPFLNTP